MPLLRLLPLNDSFADEWPKLAAEAGCALELLAEPGGASRPPAAPGASAMTLVSAPGDEERLEGALDALPRGDGPVACVGAVPDHRLAAAVVRRGATDYFALPADLPLLRAWLREGSARQQAADDARAFSARERAKYRFDGILGDSSALHAALERAARIIPHATVTVLINGETGTGKELLARAIHYNGPRRDAPFVDLNCAAIPEQLLESELFGHEKGAFTSATAAKPGLMELANGGTIFLDEIGHLALPLQGKLLRALEERSIRRVGGTRSIPIDVRVVAATHVNLIEAVKRGEFREDLLYRLNVVPIELPPLRARLDDIVPIARAFLARFAKEYGVPVPQLSAGAVDTLRTHRWPGNVRELRNAMERAVLLAGPELQPADIVEGSGGASGAGAPGELPFPATLHELARAAAQRMVELCGGNKSEASRRLGISRPRLQRLLAPGGDGADMEDFDA